MGTPTGTGVAPAQPVSLLGQMWRYLLAALISATAWWELAAWQAANQPAWLVFDIVAGIACYVMVWWRRRRPLTIAVVTIVLSTFSGLAAGPAVLATVSLATRRRWLEIIPIAVLTMVCSVVAVEISPLEDESTWFLLAPILVAATVATLAWGMYIGSRRDLLISLQERAEEAEAEQAIRIANARNTERARIAREMHDVLAHRISMVALHAGALAYRDDLSTEEIRRSAEVIQTSSHEALVELREVLGVLRDGPGDAAPERPQPSARDLPDLLEEFKTTGMNLSWKIDLELSSVPAPIGRAAYRVIQEALTNAGKHAPHARASVAVSGCDDQGLLVEVQNKLGMHRSTNTPGSGLGLVGLKERVELVGGQLTKEVTAESFVLKAWLPWTP